MKLKRIKELKRIQEDEAKWGTPVQYTLSTYRNEGS